MTLFQSEDPPVYQSKKTRISLKKSDLRSSLKFMQNEDWLSQVAGYYESHFKNLGRWWHLLGLQQMTIGLPPLNYGNEKVRSQFHIMMRGQPGVGKSKLAYTVETVGVNPNELGEVTAPKLVGSIDKGRWIAGEAYKAKDGILIIPELSETIKGGEHYEAVIFHLIQLMEDQRLTRSLVKGFDPEAIDEEREKYPDVVFSDNKPNSVDGKFMYETNACLLVGTWEMNEAHLMEKVTAGFYSRIFEIPINYTKSQLFGVLDNVADNISGVGSYPENIDADLIRSSFEVMYCANKGLLVDYSPFTPLTGIVFPSFLAHEFMNQYKDLVTFILRDLDLEKDGDVEENTVLPTLIREPLDGYRFAVADAISRRFCGTMDDRGIVTVDEDAINVATEYLRILVNRRVELYKKLNRYMKLSSVEPELAMSDEYRLIFGAGKEGISLDVFKEICTKRYNVSERTIDRHIDKLCREKSIKKVQSLGDNRRIKLVSSIFAVEEHPLRGLL